MQTLFPDNHLQPRWSGVQLASLLAVPGIGPARLRRIVEHWPSVAAYEADPDKSWLGPWAAELPIRIQPVAAPPGVTVVGYFDESYPALLREIPDPPPVLWCRGGLPSNGRALAIVGTRHPDRFGRRVAAAAAEAAASLRITVVSGLAIGCDTVAHEAAVRAGGSTIAVLAGMLERPSPARNRPLADRILDTGGALVSEVPPETPVSPARLIARNRIQSGLSRATMVSQTGIRGGTLHTARFALEQGRKLIVARPSGRWKTELSAGNLALTDERAADPRFLGGTEKFQIGVAGRRPLADIVVDQASDLPHILREIFD